MKLTRSKLKEIIREEIQKLNEANASDTKQNIKDALGYYSRNIDKYLPSTDRDSIAYEGPEGQKAYKQLGKELETVERSIQKFGNTLLTKLQKISRKY
ncbi:hypothetical protein CL614_01275 [archaeon]|nr:hypothetical protein [archaeon]|tara:strand:- start:43 stop:336 length:294 start_codon:yes stop_codon:yes gene_type:complete